MPYKFFCNKVLKIFVLIMLALFLTSFTIINAYQYDVSVKKDINGIETKLTKECVIDLISKNIIKANNYKKISDILLNNYTYLSDDLIPIKYSEKVPWHDLKGTYNLDINSFNDIQLLNYLYEYTNDLLYLKKSKELILDWMQYEKSDISKQNRYVWYDHAVSYRTLSMIYFLLLENEQNIFLFDSNTVSSINDYILRQGKWLYDDKNYPHGNHGMMMDMALLELSVYIQDKNVSQQYCNKSLKRISNRLLEDFTSNGVHLENSPSYHMYVMSWYMKIVSFIENYYPEELENFNIIVDHVKKMQGYLVRTIMPNLMFARIGDTASISPSTDFNNDELQYLSSKGSLGSKPQEGTFYYNEAGIALYREDWSKEHFENSIWWNLKSGAKNIMHKHDDDLSFMIYGCGNEIFTDAGQYNYDQGNEFRQYVLSPEGHNSLSIKGISYNGRFNYDKIDILQEVERTDDYVWYRAVNRAYEHTHITRNFIFFNPNIFIIVDDVVSVKDDNIYTQHFLLGKDMEIIDYSNGGFSAISNDGKANVYLNQYLDIDNAEYYRADDTNYYGYISEYFEKKTPIDYISFENTGGQTKYVTSIAINKKAQNRLKNVEVSKTGISVYIDDKKYNFIVNKLNVEDIENNLENTLAVKSEKYTENGLNYKYEVITYNPNTEYAFYLYKDGAVIDKTGYSKKNYYEFTPKDFGKYYVQYFIVRNDIENKYKTVEPGTKLYGVSKDKISLTEKEFNFKLKNSLIIKDMHLDENSKTYKFTIDFYNPNLEYAFYLYKNDERIDTKNYSDENYYEFAPTEQGEYSVRWFVCKKDVKNKTQESIGDNKRSEMFSDKVVIN